MMLFFIVFRDKAKTSSRVIPIPVEKEVVTIEGELGDPVSTQPGSTCTDCA